MITATLCQSIAHFCILDWLASLPGLSWQFGRESWVGFAVASWLNKTERLPSHAHKWKQFDTYLRLPTHTFLAAASTSDWLFVFATLSVFNVTLAVQVIMVTWLKTETFSNLGHCEEVSICFLSMTLMNFKRDLCRLDSPKMQRNRHLNIWIWLPGVKL